MTQVCITIYLSSKNQQVVELKVAFNRTILEYFIKKSKKAVKIFFYVKKSIHLRFALDGKNLRALIKIRKRN